MDDIIVEIIGVSVAYQFEFAPDEYNKGTTTLTVLDQHRDFVGEEEFLSDDASSEEQREAIVNRWLELNQLKRCD